MKNWFKHKNPGTDFKQVQVTVTHLCALQVQRWLGLVGRGLLATSMFGGLVWLPGGCQRSGTSTKVMGFFSRGTVGGIQICHGSCMGDICYPSPCASLANLYPGELVCLCRNSVVYLAFCK